MIAITCQKRIYIGPLARTVGVSMAIEPRGSEHSNQKVRQTPDLSAGIIGSAMDAIIAVDDSLFETSRNVGVRKMRYGAEAAAIEQQDDKAISPGGRSGDRRGFDQPLGFFETEELRWCAPNRVRQSATPCLGRVVLKRGP
jgi:hypothetical protein